MALPMKAVAMKKGGAKKVTAIKTLKGAKRVSIIAKGSRAKSSVFSGRKVRTKGGLRKEHLMQNKGGKVVSKKASAVAKLKYMKSSVKAWIKVVTAARKALGMTGFVATGGKYVDGVAPHSKATSLRVVWGEAP